jgi:hypothetical protein
MFFRFTRLRLEFRAQDPLYFPPQKAANTLRGALLSILTTPTPFVFRARHLDGRTFQPGEPFHFDLHVFRPVEDQITQAFESLAREGFGPTRGKVQFQRATIEPITLDLSPDPSAPSRIRVDFLTPTELKYHNKIASRPEFPTLFARTRQRISMLSGVGVDANPSAIRMTRCEISRQRIERYSTRTGQTHSIGSFIGFAEYSGDFAEFLPYLKAAQWTGVGRHAVWGNGEIAVSPPTY